MKKVLSMVLLFTLTLSMGVITTSAETLDLGDSEVYYSIELGGTFIRRIEGDKVIVKWIPKESDVKSFTIINENGNVYCNNYTIDLYLSENLVIASDSNIRWGTWQTFSNQINTGGLAAAELVGLISSCAPWLPVRVIGSVVVTTISYSKYYVISGKLRLGTDDKYDYHERYTSIQDDDGEYLLKDYFDSGKKLIK